MLKRESIQRHVFICGTTGSGKSYAMGVLAEELLKHGLPVIFLDTQDEYSQFVKQHGGTVVEPGKNFTIRISSLTESELLDLLPEAMKKERTAIRHSCQGFW
jgi:type IV secretory pathway VirB4 component